MQSRALRTPLLLSLLGASGCAPLAVRGTVAIPHPDTTPVLAAGTQVAIPDAARERALGLDDGTLVDRAALTRVTPAEVCVQLALFAPPGDPERSAIEAYELRLVATGPTEAERREPAIGNVRAWVEQRSRHLRDAWTGARVEGRIALPHRVGDLCFRNEGLLGPRTEALSLVLRRGGRERRFSWRFQAGARYREGADDGAGVHPAADDPLPLPPGAAPGAGGIGGLTAFSVERTPGGHPVDVRRLRQLSDARFGLFRRCLSREAERDPHLNLMRGRMTSEFTVGPSGVRNVRVIRNDFTEGAADCMRRHLSGLPIGPDPNRWTSIFRYTLVIEPTAGARP